jgi:hypothetical protein
VHKHIAEMNWKTRKEEMMRDGGSWDLGVHFLFEKIV